MFLSCLSTLITKSKIMCQKCIWTLCTLDVYLVCWKTRIETFVVMLQLIFFQMIIVKCTAMWVTIQVQALHLRCLVSTPCTLPFYWASCSLNLFCLHYEGNIFQALSGQVYKSNCSFVFLVFLCRLKFPWGLNYLWNKVWVSFLNVLQVCGAVSCLFMVS